MLSVQSFMIVQMPLWLIFFAGSGTTLNAVNLLNATDDGNRQCILVTNNEVSEDDTKTLCEQGHRPGSDEWNIWLIFWNPIHQAWLTATPRSGGWPSTRRSIMMISAGLSLSG